MKPLLVLLLLFVASPALAQSVDPDAAVASPANTGAMSAPPTAPAVQPAPAADINPGDTAEKIYTAVKSGKWMVTFGLVLILITWGARTLLAKKFEWFKTKAGGYLLGGITAFTATIGGSLAAGEPFSLGLLSTSLSVVWVTSGGWTMLRDIFDAGKAAKAKAT